MEADRRRVADALDSYDVGAEVGRGAWGVVYVGHHRRLDRAVAIKQLPAAFGADAEVRARFTSEARLIASLDHPHIVPVYDYVERDGLYLIVMEYLPGGTLWTRFTDSGVALDEAVAVLLAVCSALHYAHEKGILHRDVKPDNVVRTAAGVPKLTDFGLAKLLGGARTALTAVGTAVGTPAYMAPEQARGHELGPATDVYACGVMLYELLAGSLPFSEAPDPMAQLYQHVHEPPRPLGEVAPAVPAGLVDVVMRALAKAPQERYPTAQDLGVALAGSATAAWGPGWVERTGTTVMDRGPIMAATHQSPARARTSQPTVIIRGTGAGHHEGPTPPSWSEPARPAPPEEVAGLDLGASGPGPPTSDRVPSEEPAPDPLGIGRGDPDPSAPGPAVLAPLPDSGQAASARPRRRKLLAGAATGFVVLAAVGALIAFVVAGGSDADRATADVAEDPVVPGPVTVAPRAPVPERPPGRFVQVDDVRVEGDRYVVAYTPFEFEPLIAHDPAEYHVHFFWDTQRPTQAGTNAADFGDEVGQWVLWDAPVFDAFAVADRPPGAAQICAVVATHDHRVDNPDNYSCAPLPN